MRRSVKISGTADLPLHGGHVPPWLMERMKTMASAIVKVIVEDHGKRELLRRLGDPYWFQSLGCVLGFDWHSSGLTTVVTGALREVLSLDSHGVMAVGGKGGLSRKIPEKISELDLSDSVVNELIRASRLTAKVDNAVLQDGYQIYHHIIIFTEDGGWTVIQQGMNPELRYARRYHWIGEDVESFVVEPHSGIAGSRSERLVLNMVSRGSEEARKTSVDLVSENPSKLIRLVNLAIDRQETLTAWIERDVEERISIPKHLNMPKRINWRAVRRAYDRRPRDYEELIEVKGLGPSTIRALALISALIYGARIDWRDPLKFSFAVGGKDGVPYPVSRRTYDRAIAFMRQILEAAEVERDEKKLALKRLLNLERRLYG